MGPSGSANANHSNDVPDRKPRSQTVLIWIAFPGTMILAFILLNSMTEIGVPTEAGPYLPIVVVAGVVTLLERVIPYRRSWLPRRNDVGNDALFFTTVQMLLPFGLFWFFSVTLLRYLDQRSLSVSEWWPHGFPPVIQLALMLIVAEFFRYWLHVAAHNTKTLWRLHAVHHSPKKLYWFNAGRFHPVEKALQYLLDALPFIVLGVRTDVLALYFVFYATNGFFQHSNVDARYGVLNYVVSSAELHRWHHSRRIEESNNNYGNNLIVWDLVFGSWFLPRNRHVGDLGLINPDYPLGFFKQLITPLTPGLDKRNLRHNAS